MSLGVGGSHMDSFLWKNHCMTCETLLASILLISHTGYQLAKLTQLHVTVFLIAHPRGNSLGMLNFRLGGRVDCLIRFYHLEDKDVSPIHVWVFGKRK